LPKHLDEKVASLHLDKLGVKLTAFSAAQARYLGPPPAGPAQTRALPLLGRSPRGTSASTDLSGYSDMKMSGSRDVITADTGRMIE
jgi:hypothetical protein